MKQLRATRPSNEHVLGSKDLRALTCLLVVVALTAAGCGGGGGGTPAVNLTGITPATLAAASGGAFTIAGGDFSSVGGGTADVTFTAQGGATPFSGGTADVATVPAMLNGAGELEGALPAACVAGGATVNTDVTVKVPSGAVSPGGEVAMGLQGHSVTGFTPAAPIVGTGTVFTVTGTGFGPASGTATVTFTAAPATTPFAGGTSNTLVVTGATIASTSQITGTCPDPAVAGSVAATVTATLACGTTATGGGGVAANFAAAGVQGKLQYEHVPHVAYNGAGTATQTSGLDYGSIVLRDLAGVKVQVVRTSDQAVLASTASAADGTYKIDLLNGDTVVLRVLAQSHTGPDLQVIDNNNLNAVWAMDSAPFTIGTSVVTQDLTATTGWGGASYTGTRAAAPFSVFSTIWAAKQKILASVTPTPVFPPLQVKWSPGNNQVSAFWDGTFIMLRGADGVNTDEFDTHVLVHEWGHYFESSFSRSDSPGGQHFINQSYHPSLAWGEGWANGLAAMMLEPDAIYSDTSGVTNGSGFMVDLERRLSPTASNFGWYNEWTVWELVYDLADTNNEGAWDTLSLGIQGMFNSLANGQKNTDALTTVFSFINTLKADNPGSAAAIDAMCAMHGMTSPVADQWGTGEANNGGAASNLPVHKPLTLNAAATGLSLTRVAFNNLTGGQFFRFTGNGSQVTVHGTSPAGNAQNLPQFYTYANGVYQTGSGIGPAPGASSSASFTSVNGQVYVIWGIHAGTAAGGVYFPTVRVSSP